MKALGCRIAGQYRRLERRNQLMLVRDTKVMYDRIPHGCPYTVERKGRWVSYR